MRHDTVSAPSPAPAASPQHLPFLDGIRAIAAVFVVLHHALLQVVMSGMRLNHVLGDGRGVAALTWPLMQGHTAVNVFITLSGFCLMLPLVRRQGVLNGGARTFYKKRARRILPPYLAAITLSLLLIFTLIGRKTGTHWDISVPVTLKGVVAHLVMAHDFFPAYSGMINGSFWSISVESRIYIVFPLFLVLWRRFHPVAVTIALVVVSYAMERFLPITTRGININYIGLFALGMLAAQIARGSAAWEQTARERVPWGVATVVLGVAGWLTLVGPGLIGRQPPFILQDLVAGLCSAALFVYLSASETSRLRALLSWSPLAFVGTFAYSLYLIHAPLLQVWTQYVCFPLHLGPQAALATLFFIATPLIVGVSYLFFLVAEKPFLSAKLRAAATAEQAAAAQAVA